MSVSIFFLFIPGDFLAAAKSFQLCPTLCDPIDGSPPGSPIPGILQARTLEWVAISFSNAWKWKVKVKSLSRVWLFTTPSTAAYRAPLSMGFSRQEYWSGVPLPSPDVRLVCGNWVQESKCNPMTNIWCMYRNGKKDTHYMEWNLVMKRDIKGLKTFFFLISISFYFFKESVDICYFYKKNYWSF